MDFFFLDANKFQKKLNFQNYPKINLEKFLIKRLYSMKNGFFLVKQIK